MAENVTLARPYAEAAFARACEQGQLSSWADSLQRLALVLADADAQTCVANPQLSDEQIAVFLIGAAQGSLTEEQQNFVRILVENSRASLLPEIYALFRELKNAHEGVGDARVSSAFPLDEASIAKLTADLETRFKTKLHLTVTIDPELIGGVRIVIGDEVIDASVRGKLASMAAALQN